VAKGTGELFKLEDELSTEWPNCLDGKERAFRVISAFWRLLRSAADRTEADVVFVDVGPNLGAITVPPWWLLTMWCFRWHRTCSAPRVCRTSAPACVSGGRNGVTEC
jgi:hypothetical protein